jgi:acylpyruvate hydrolase
MIFDIPTLIVFLSQGTTLEAGSIIMTGTPAGVGFMMEPPQYLADGDIVQISVEGVGTLVNRIKHTT